MALKHSYITLLLTGYLLDVGTCECQKELLEHVEVCRIDRACGSSLPSATFLFFGLSKSVVVMIYSYWNLIVFAISYEAYMKSHFRVQLSFLRQNVICAKLLTEMPH